MTSPVITPTAPTTSPMIWSDAEQRVLDGQKIRRLSWTDDTLCVLLANGILSHRLATGVVDGLIVSEADMRATDWVVVREN
jgi:hypothetical protein